MTTNWKPSRKWFATQVTALTALALMYVTTGAWNQEETIAAIGIVSQAALSWLVPNDPDQLRRDAAAGERGQVNVLSLLVYFLVVVILLVLLFALIDRV